MTGLQTQNGSGHTSPNVAILAKLREEMNLLAERKKSFTPLGKLTRNTAALQEAAAAAGDHASEYNAENYRNYPVNL